MPITRSRKHFPGSGAVKPPDSPAHGPLWYGALLAAIAAAPALATGTYAWVTKEKELQITTTLAYLDRAVDPTLQPENRARVLTFLKQVSPDGNVQRWAATELISETKKANELELLRQQTIQAQQDAQNAQEALFLAESSAQEGIAELESKTQALALAESKLKYARTAQRAAVSQAPPAQLDMGRDSIELPSAPSDPRPWTKCKSGTGRIIVQSKRAEPRPEGAGSVHPTFDTLCRSEPGYFDEAEVIDDESGHRTWPRYDMRTSVAVRYLCGCELRS